MEYDAENQPSTWKYDWKSDAPTTTLLHLHKYLKDIPRNPSAQKTKQGCFCETIT